PSSTDFTDYGAIAGVQVKSFMIKNEGKGILKIQNIEINGLNSIDFTLLNTPAFPVSIPANSSVSFTVKFAPSQLGLRKAEVAILSNDIDEKSFTYSIQAIAIDGGEKGPSSSQSPYLLSTVQGGKFTS